MRACWRLLAVLLLAGLAYASDPGPSLNIPRVSSPPSLDDFEGMHPSGAALAMARVTDFTEVTPSDGKPSTQRTEAYIGYDHTNIYVVFVCYDDPRKVRATMTRRENAGDDDWVRVWFDTFNDHRRGYIFEVNPLGIQEDMLYSEENGMDTSWDAVWSSKGKLTPQGYLVWIAIPFRSVRFPRAAQQTWGILFQRYINHSDENTFWPRVSSRVQGRFNQDARLDGLEDISAGRNMQFTPYFLARSFRATDTPAQCVDTACSLLLPPTQYASKTFQPDGGLDAKFVLKDSLVLDFTANPDFSQVESDEPQVTVNQRFELWYPEKRPFFMENSNYFNTPITLLFTRRIADPQFGVRLTGKLGPYSIGFLATDDQAPGRSVAPDNPEYDKRAYDAVFRFTRDIFKQSRIGLIFTDHEFQGASNRVGGVDAHFKINKNWTGDMQTVTSATRYLDGSHEAGPASSVFFNYSGRKTMWNGWFDDVGQGFQTQLGFVNRTGIRDVGQWFYYRFRPEGKHLIAWGPTSSVNFVWDHTGTRLDIINYNDFRLELKGSTQIGVLWNTFRERLRPQDFSTLLADQDYSHHTSGFFFATNLFKSFSFGGVARWGERIDYVPAAGPPKLGNSSSGDLWLTFKPFRGLVADTTWIWDRLRDPATHLNLYNEHIIRSKWNYQFTRELSLRVILQYNALISNPAISSLAPNKSFNTDVLLTYYVRPGTAVYVGYNSNMNHPDPVWGTNRFVNDGRQVFVKMSYLFRF